MSSPSSGSSRRRRPGPAGRPAAAGADAGTVLRAQVTALNRRDLDGLAALYAEDAVLEFPASAAVAGRNAIRRAFARFFEDWEEEVTLHRVIAAGSAVAAEGTAAGRHRLLPARIAGRTPLAARGYRHGFAVFLEVHRGRIRRHRVYYDSRDLVRQLLGP